jgi:cytochrome P450
VIQNVYTCVCVQMDLLGGETEPTMMAVEWALAELLQNPETMKQALSELDTIVGVDHIVEESDLKQLGYLEAIVKEILHLHPPLPIVFHASHETEWQVIQGYSLPPVMGLFVNVWAIGRDPNAWEKPLEFNPQRFIQNKKNIDVTGQCFELLPFGSGHLFSNLLIQIIFAHMLQSFNWFLQIGQKLQNIDMSEKPNWCQPSQSTTTECCCISLTTCPSL